MMPVSMGSPDQRLRALFSGMISRLSPPTPLSGPGFRILQEARSASLETVVWMHRGSIDRMHEVEPAMIS
ncbi:hypothetical protein HMPREF0762_02026 [Slackia exigua ATCC 700122]|uniref:Uncharacterized protein n=1 Tax=Slackia exigua (strain ATCC 700122 / DSM 15923 / CIP 105133 / JCM 11022 / KCTC 5966 / S-7) TaxID=649764 RepID=D0WJK0_SLAES|nr:hypothetical protein HMPREF0762_02026 [Slackia exigua ATCC 700122]